MEKNWKLILAFGVLLIGISISYYFLFFMPKNKEAEILSENQSKCLQMKDKSLTEYNKSISDYIGKKSDSASASNHYNTKLKKCIVEIVDNTYSSVPPYSISQSISVTDAVENTNLISGTYGIGEHTLPDYYWKGIGDKNDTLTKEQFEKLEKEYMNQ